MSEPLDPRGLSLLPKNVAPDAWYYESHTGLEIYSTTGLVCILPWRKVEASVRRKQKARTRR